MGESKSRIPSSAAFEAIQCGLSLTLRGDGSAWEALVLAADLCSQVGRDAHALRRQKTVKTGRSSDQHYNNEELISIRQLLPLTPYVDSMCILLYHTYNL